MASSINGIRVRGTQFLSSCLHKPLYNFDGECCDTRSYPAFQSPHIRCNPILIINLGCQSSEKVLYGPALWHV